MMAVQPPPSLTLPHKGGGNPHAVIIGATSSLAEALCRQLAQAGVELSLFGRDTEALGLLSSDLEIRFGIKTQQYPLDIERLENLSHWESTVEALPPFDTVFLIPGAMPTNNTPNDVISAITANFTGPAVWLTLLARRLKEQKNGKIAVISSVAGDRGRLSNYVYGSAKGGLSLFAAGLRGTLYQKGIHVMTVKPGYFDTPMTYGMKTPLMASREYVAHKILVALQKNKNEVYIPFFWKYILFLIKLIPEAIFKRFTL